MARLSCLRPQLDVKEIWVYLLAYDLIRIMIAAAAPHVNRLPRHLSFKHIVQICVFLPHHRDLILRDDLSYPLCKLIAQQQVGD